MSSLEVLFTPADFDALRARDLSNTCCVVFDVLRATSTMVTALWNGAKAILPVEEIAEAITLSKSMGEVLLAGERDGLRISATLTGGRAFDLGNSPREFTAAAVGGKTVIMTTTNGTRALRACRHALQVLAGSLLNLSATAATVCQAGYPDLLVICSGTLAQAAYEDVLGAGAFCDALWEGYSKAQVADSALMARDIFIKSRHELTAAAASSRNGRRLLANPELSQDIDFCTRTDAFSLVAAMDQDGFLRRQS